MRKSSILRNKGFALVATISVLSILVLVAIGMLSLSTVTSRTTEIQIPMEQAKANARMALMLAIAELQKTTGPDTRITAPADILSEQSAVSSNHVRQLMGVWKAWEGLNHISDPEDDSAGLPIAPDYNLKTVSESSGGRFIKWLVSDESQNLGDPTNPPSITAAAGRVPLLADGSLPSDSDETVYLLPSDITNQSMRGSYAWWIQGENTKVRIKPNEQPETDFDAVGQIVVSPGPSGDAFNIPRDATLVTKNSPQAIIEKAISRASLDLTQSTNSEAPSDFFHDVTVNSVGLQTNVATGGWKRDLSLFTENNGVVSENFSAFSLSADQIHTASKTGISDGVIYPWANPAGSSSTWQSSVTWSALIDYMTQYKQLTTSGDPLAALTDSTAYQRQDGSQQVELATTVRRMPVLARVHTVFSLSARPNSNNPALYEPCVIVNPVVTMWNPYDVALDMSWRWNLRINLTMGAPFSVKYTLGGVSSVRSISQLGLSSINIPTGSPSSTWLPGEVRVFSPTGGATIRDEGATLTYAIGCNPVGGVRYDIPGFTDTTGDQSLSADEAQLVAIHNGPSVQGTGVYYTVKRASSRMARPNNTMNKSCLLDSLGTAGKMLGDNLVLTGAGGTLASLSSTPQPFLSSMMSLRFARDVNDQMNNILVNGIHSMNPAIAYMVQADDAQNSTDLADRFDAYPYNVLLFSVSSYADTAMPSGFDSDSEGYLGSGFQDRDGLSNLVLLEIPKTPLSTIGDLQHFTINKNNRWAPYTLNAMGNSRASAFIGQKQIRVGGLSLREVGHDHSFAANHLFMDDWFVSSVAPEMNVWSSSEVRSIEQVYADHLSGEKLLPNHYYKPASNTDDAATFLSRGDAWQRIASEMVVEGMFNINSTSEKAWAMLLKRNFHTDSPGVLSVATNSSESRGSALLNFNAGSPFPRTQLTSDPAGSAYSVLAESPRFSDGQIDALAREIVSEIKKRGPFLSLSEFFNRQLSDDVELARSGAVESALDTLSNSANLAENPYAQLQAAFSDEASTVDARSNAPENLSYPFPEAAEGNPAYGFPGWARQADVLRPISGLLSARDDTFTIRAYGAAKDTSGKVLAEAWCEAVVQRYADYVDPADSKHLPMLPDQPLTSESNKEFGRQYQLISFRWLNADEV